MSQPAGNPDLLKDLVSQINVFYDNLNVYIYFTEGKAFRMLTDQKETEKILTSLIKLQRIYGIIVTLHPESVYSPTFKISSDLFDKVFVIAEETSNLIDEALNVWQIIMSEIKPYTKNPRYCYKLLTTQFQGTKYSFHTFILKLLSNCEKLISYLGNLRVGEEIKAGLSTVRSDKMSQDINVENPPELKNGEKPKDV